jgi:UDP-N-acetylmuramoyl-L-alanyl-D-glutamate--2,6-diaminopimelate ligase
MERYTVGGRTVLDDTAAHPESFEATLAVAALLPHDRLVVVYAVRGSRGADINQRNAEALAALAAERAVHAFILTASQEATGPADRVRPHELAAARDALIAAGRPFVEHDTLDGAIRDALERTTTGDLIVLIGAQGMNGGKERLTKI